MLKSILLKIPVLYRWLQALRGKVSNKPDLTSPKVESGEFERVAEVLLSPSWNICYGTSGLMHHRLEDAFAEYTNTKYAVAVNTGGMAIQMSLRALGVKPGDEVVQQVDTCVANAFAAINAYGTPIFADIDLKTNMPGRKELEAAITPRTKVLVPIHIWGNAMDMEMVQEVAKAHGLKVLEDCCLGLGAEWKNKRVGSFGDVGIFSFGCLKPIQTGEGGMITTNDEALAKELRTIRSYGDMSWEYGVRDNRTLSWNGRISEILAAVGLEQLKSYPAMLTELAGNVAIFQQWLSNIEGIEIVTNGYKSSYTQVSLAIDPAKFNKASLMQHIGAQGINVWHANFEPITTLSYFKTDEWRNWILKGDTEYVAQNYAGSYPNAFQLYNSLGMGIARQHFISEKNTRHLITLMEQAIRLS